MKYIIFLVFSIQCFAADHMAILKASTLKTKLEQIGDSGSSVRLLDLIIQEAKKDSPEYSLHLWALARALANVQKGPVPTEPNQPERRLDLRFETPQSSGESAADVIAAASAAGEHFAERSVEAGRAQFQRSQNQEIAAKASLEIIEVFAQLLIQASIAANNRVSGSFADLLAINRASDLPQLTQLLVLTPEARATQLGIIQDLNARELLESLTTTCL